MGQYRCPENPAPCGLQIRNSYLTDSDGARLVEHIKDVYYSPGGKERKALEPVYNIG